MRHVAVARSPSTDDEGSVLLVHLVDGRIVDRVTVGDFLAQSATLETASGREGDPEEADRLRESAEAIREAVSTRDQGALRDIANEFRLGYDGIFAEAQHHNDLFGVVSRIVPRSPVYVQRPRFVIADISRRPRSRGHRGRRRTTARGSPARSSGGDEPHPPHEVAEAPRRGCVATVRGSR